MDKYNYNASLATCNGTSSPQIESDKSGEMSPGSGSSSSLNANASKRSRSPSVNDDRKCNKIRRQSKIDDSNVSKKSRSELISKNKSNSRNGSKKIKAVFTDSEDEQEVVDNSEKIKNTDDNKKEEIQKENALDVVNDENSNEPDNASSAISNGTYSLHKSEDVSSSSHSSSTLNSNTSKISRSPSVNEDQNSNKMRRQSENIDTNVSKKTTSELKTKFTSKSRKGSTSRIVKKRKAVFTDSEDEQEGVENSKKINNTDDNKQEESQKENALDVVNGENLTEPDNASSANSYGTNSPQIENKSEEVSSSSHSSSSLNSDASKRSRSPSVNGDRNCIVRRKSNSADSNISKKSKSELKSKSKSKSRKGSDSANEEEVIENSEKINNTDDDMQKENALNIVNAENQTETDNYISDFDAMMLRKKKEKASRRKQQDINLINDNDDAIDKLIQRMKAAADEDRVLNKHSQPATKKISMLKQVMSQLIKKDLQMAFIEHNVLNALTDWLAPLPNKSLPCLQIREGILKLLSVFPTIDKYYLKESGIGKAVMYLYKHPQEIKTNRDRAGRLISDWVRPIFNLSVDSISREERQNLDLQHSRIPRTKRNSSPEPDNRKKDDFGSSLATQENASGHDDKGGNPRTSVPSNKVYVVRPKSSINVDINMTNKKQSSRYEKYVKRFISAKHLQNARRPVQISVEGRKMPL